VTVEHAASMTRAIPNAELAVVPGTDHALMFEKPDLVNRLILDFLDDARPPRFMSADHAAS
jgi:pimeloyl-ACP methyl ester carboxylesterase